MATDDQALAELSASREPTHQDVHSVRKRLKKLRGLVTLARYGLGKRRYAAENACYRDAGKMLASARQASAVLGS